MLNRVLVIKHGHESRPVSARTVVSAFLRRHSLEAACEASLLRPAHADPKVLCTRSFRPPARRHSNAEAGPHWQCGACHHPTSLRAGTIFDHTRLRLTTWLTSLAIHRGTSHTKHGGMWKRSNRGSHSEIRIPKRSWAAR